MGALFGPAGNSESFAAMGYKGSLDVPEYIQKMGLDAFEYQCGRGVNIGEEKARQLGALAAERGIALSVHAPYYISLASKEEAKRDNSIRYICESARAVHAMGGERIVVHPGGLGGLPREKATALAGETLKRALECLDSEGLSTVRVCPETMGKINQLGNLDEVLTLCELDERMLPCIDFGHLNARAHGGLNNMEAFGAVFDAIRNRLGESRLKEFHAHFSKIAYTDGGEKMHLTFEDQTYGPNFEPMLEWTARLGCSPVIICESAGTQAEDAAAMKGYYQSLLSK